MAALPPSPPAIGPGALPRLSQVLRHRIRNFSGGAHMALHYLGKACASDDPQAGDFLQALEASIDDLFRFSQRFDLVADALPAPHRRTLGECLDSARQHVTAVAPYASLQLSQPIPALAIVHGSWLTIALQELADNALQAQPRAAELDIEVVALEPLGISLTNPAGDARALPPLPASPFANARGGHDGLGLAIVSRLCAAVGGEVAADYTSAGRICLTLSWPDQRP